MGEVQKQVARDAGDELLAHLHARPLAEQRPPEAGSSIASALPEPEENGFAIASAVKFRLPALSAGWSRFIALNPSPSALLGV
jgi:hypothetical protein